MNTKAGLTDRSRTMTTLEAKPAIPESDVDMVKRHVRNAEARLAAQRKMIAILAARRQPLKQAQELLQLYEFTWQAHVDHLAHVEDVARRRALPGREGGRSGYREASERMRVRRFG